ncbi:tetratricopeptide repeat protein [Lusitaniella coriacea LEGE 07157]|uniref:Tetratricopeptide repeat protein n=1 Tax=Lusitaniella coriacea LEGE 07157 TaxID=945747 RepID=A0A8J7J1E3_9CYAN|nr:tetratricopeptide repeat protein [Lusitaniella coriacea]MBE9115714.1 tetratricopeptide repeat protein [Lusitaniella coriacea LEGE 07157]
MKRLLTAVMALSGVAFTSTTAFAQEANSFEEWANQCYELSGEPALEACDKAIELNANDATVWTNRGRILYADLGRTEEALESLNRAIAIAPNDSLALYNRCTALAALERYQQAIDSCDRAIAGDGRWGESDPSRAWVNRGVSLRRLGRHNEAIESYDRAIEINPNDALVWNNKGAVLYEVERYADALSAFEEALRLDPNHELARRNRNIVQQRLSGQ